MVSRALVSLASLFAVLPLYAFAPADARAPAAVPLPAAPAPAPVAAASAARPIRYVLRRMRHPDGAAFDAHVVYVDLCDPAVDLRATAPDEGRRPVSAWARLVGAAVAINGDFFDGAVPTPLGPARGRGRDWAPRGTYYFGAILAMRPGAPPEIVEGYPTDPAWTDVVATQERLVVQGGLVLSPYVRHSPNRHPRTGVGLTRDRRTLILVVVDGRSRRSAGVRSAELGVLLQQLGAWEGVRMDGGGSSAMYLAGRGVVNRPSDGHERAVANHLGVVLNPNAPRGARAFCQGP
jgi:hypothetical protein